MNTAPSANGRLALAGMIHGYLAHATTAQLERLAGDPGESAKRARFFIDVITDTAQLADTPREAFLGCVAAGGAAALADDGVDDRTAFAIGYAAAHRWDQLDGPLPDTFGLSTGCALAAGRYLAGLALAAMDTGPSDSGQPNTVH